ncbi:MAG: leucine--tRNA ligase [Candidatus Bathyarchaeota archaeon]|jgi:leucyl-tRNA synthetase|nr:leucine--tRNA ligase [Candidatus Bathyarchaeota archaeon A05DMB-5]MDH7557746.1 leucine--tRNA ligase [Candidatus Bathyarchaeota archaeon]
MEFLKKTEEKWQKRWEKAKIFEANPDPKKPKYYITVAYPYPNSPQHIGHGRTYTLADVHARYMRMRGYNVLLPMAFHYTGTPVLAMAKRLAENDKDLIKDFITIYKIPKEKLKELTEPITMARYFHQEIKTGMKEIGYSIDWRREFTTVDPHYNRFIEWQFQKLRKGGYIKRGSHPVGFCPKCGNPVGMHDTKGDVEPEIGEFTVIKFKQNSIVFPTATLRPETIFGVTNIWLNPNAKYVKAKINGEQWIISKESAEKLTYQKRKVKIIETFEGKQLIGKKVENPATKTKILILPADFVDPKNATGVVMSVPGHAPYDYVALENIKKTPSKLKEYGITTDAINAIKPISLIQVPNYSEIPPADVVKKMQIQNQTDPKLEDATKEVYRHEFHNGKMKQNTGKYQGMTVAEAKDKVKKDLIAENKATTMYELLNRPVLCRCGTECIVKILEDQWFIDYGKPEWKALARKNLEKMEILPEEMRPEYNYVIDWLHEKACARKSGMGTRLPWDKEWIIESLSDSTIYMAYYTIVKHIKEHKIKAEQLTENVFDYIFLGKGNPTTIAKKTKIDTKTLKAMHNEFSYFYPLDSRHSAHELIPNHLTFMIFNHTAIFPEKHWPRQIVTNGHVLMEGAKMSKSFGNIIPLREGLTKFGADPIRLSVLATAELLQDVDFSPSVAKSMRERLERLHRFVAEFAKKKHTRKTPKKLSAIDKWMLSRLQEHIRKTTEAMDKLAVRKAIHTAIYELDQDFQWYQKRTEKQKENSDKTYVIDEVLDAKIRMLAPVAPHICEELWEMMGKKNFVSTSSWPTPDKTKIDIIAEENETLIMNVLEDTSNIIKATGMKPKKIFYYTATPWKWKVYSKILEKSISGKVQKKDLMRELMADSNLRAKAEKVAKFANQIIEEINHMPEERKKKLTQIVTINEHETLKEAENFLEKELHAKIHIYNEESADRYDPKNRAQQAKPYRPAIYIE